MKRALRSTAGQTATYAGATAAASAANGLSKGLLAAVLSVSNFGAFAVGQTILMYASMFCEFGLFLPAARACAAADPDEQHEIIGAAFVLFLPVAAVFVLVILAASLFVNQLFHVDLADALRITAPLAIGWPFAYVGLQLAQGVGRLHVSALTSLFASALFLCALIGTRLLTGHTTVTGALVLQSLTLLAGGGALVVWLSPRFVGVRERIKILVRGARAYGFQVYVGRVLSVGTYNMDVLMLAALTSARVVANYALAGAIASAVGLPVTGLGNALFSRLTRSSRLEGSWLGLSWALGLASVPVTWGLTQIAVGTVFANSYAPAVALVVPLALAQAVRGVTGLYNSFLSAHGRGRELRNAAIVLTLSNVVLNFALIPIFGAQGAAWASVLALLANWFAHTVGYRQVIADEADTDKSGIVLASRADDQTVSQP